MRALSSSLGGARMITVNPVDALLQLSASYYVSRALHAVAELGVADALDETPQPARSLAAATAADAGALDRVLRLLALYGIFEYVDGVVAHTSASRMLRQDHPQSGGRQRTLHEYSELLRQAGFAMVREIDTRSGISIIEATAV